MTIPFLVGVVVVNGAIAFLFRWRTATLVQQLSLLVIGLLGLALCLAVTFRVSP